MRAQKQNGISTVLGEFDKRLLIKVRIPKYEVRNERIKCRPSRKHSIVLG